MATLDPPHLESAAHPAISAVVCTYNRADLLAGALQSLGEQTLPSSDYEVIVVDNNSSDHTLAVAEGFCRRHSNIRYCLEPQQGLSHARNRGWQEARGEYVAYTDDDCKVPEQWLEVAKEVIERVSPGVFGGPYYAYCNTSKPRWLKDTYFSRNFGDHPRFLSQSEYLSGNNIFFRRSLLRTLGGFDPKLGMAGQKIAYGEETALIQRIRTSMPDQLIYYEPKLYLYHLARTDKMTMRWIVLQPFHAGRYSYKILRGDLPKGTNTFLLLGKTVVRLLLLGADLVYGAFFRNRARYPYFQNYLFEHTSRYLRALGSYYAQARLLHHHKRRNGDSDRV
jgi:glycosyltransferase involved in cell wall biosynthesis